MFAIEDMIGSPGMIDWVRSLSSFFFSDPPFPHNVLMNENKLIADYLTFVCFFVGSLGDSYAQCFVGSRYLIFDLLEYV